MLAAGRAHEDSAPVPGPLALPGARGRRSDAGVIRLTGRDAAGLVLCGEMYGAPYDLLAAALGVREDRLRGIVAGGAALGWRRPAGSVRARRGGG